MEDNFDQRRRRRSNPASEQPSAPQPPVTPAQEPFASPPPGVPDPAAHSMFEGTGAGRGWGNAEQEPTPAWPPAHEFPASVEPSTTNTWQDHQPPQTFAEYANSEYQPPLESSGNDQFDPDNIAFEDLLSGEGWDEPNTEVGSNSWASRANEKEDQQVRSVEVELSSDEDEWGEDSQLAIKTLEWGLADNRCSEIHCNGPETIEFMFSGNLQVVNVRFTNELQYNRWIKEQVDQAEAVIKWEDVKERRHSTLRMSDGSSLTVVLPPAAAHAAITVRKHNLSTHGAGDLVANGTLTRSMLGFLQAAVAARANILVVGPMGSGKTSMLSLLSESFAANERIALLEEVPEIWIKKGRVLPLTYLPQEEGLGLSDLLETLLYMRAKRVIVGEAHFEVTKMLEIMTTGSDGSMATYHARSLLQAIERMGIGLQLEHPNLNKDTAYDLIRSAIELVVVLGVRNGKHRILEIGEIDWRQSSETLKMGRNLLWSWDEKEQQHRVHNRLNEEDRIYQKAVGYGVPIEWEWFADAHYEQMRQNRGR